MIARENMNSALSNATLTLQIFSLEQLRGMCQKFENLWSQGGFDSRNQQRFVTRHKPSFRSVNQLDCACGRDEQEFSVDEIVEESTNGEKSEVVGNIAALHINRTCFNCREAGHGLNDCSKPIKRIFCFGCGKENVLKPNCVKCLNRSLVNSFGELSTPSDSVVEVETVPITQILVRLSVSLDKNQVSSSTQTENSFTHQQKQLMLLNRYFETRKRIIEDCASTVLFNNSRVDPCPLIKITIAFKVPC